MSRALIAAIAIGAAVSGCAGGNDRRASHAGAATATPAPRAPLALAAVEAPGAHLLDRVVVLGASVSAGLAARPIASSLSAGLAPDAAVLDAASVMFFQDPFGNGRAAVDLAIGHRPTLVLALDFLFWFAYANASDDDRRARFDAGLALLADLPGTLVVGDLPDMRGANPRILGPAAVPSPDQLRALNERLRRWARARPHTLVLPMAIWTEPLVTGAPIELAPGERVAARDLMFFDGLHANSLGTWHLLMLVDAALERDLGVPVDALRLTRPAP